MTFLPYLEINRRTGPPLKILIDTGANRNYISPKIVPTKSVASGSLHRAKNINGSYIINQHTFFNPFAKYITSISNQKFHLFEFHNFFDGLIGFQTLHELGALFDTSTVELIIKDTVIPLKKKYPDLIELNFHELMSTIHEVPVSVASGDFFLEDDLQVAADVYVPSGVYSIQESKARLVFVCTQECSTNKKIDYGQIVSEMNNFEVKDFPSQIKACRRNIENEVRTDHLNDEERSKLLSLLTRNPTVFYREGDDLSFTNVIKHRINTSDELPVYTKNYRYPFVHKEEVQKQISKMLSQGIIQPSTSPWGSPI